MPPRPRQPAVVPLPRSPEWFVRAVRALHGLAALRRSRWSSASSCVHSITTYVHTPPMAALADQPTSTRAFVSRCPRGTWSGADVGCEVLAGEGGAGGHEVGGGALEDDPAAVMAGPGA